MTTPPAPDDTIPVTWAVTIATIDGDRVEHIDGTTAATGAAAYDDVFTAAHAAADTTGQITDRLLTYTLSVDGRIIGVIFTGDTSIDGTPDIPALHADIERLHYTVLDD